MLLVTYKLDIRSDSDHLGAIMEQGSPEKELEWKVGQKTPRDQIESSVYIYSVYADGDELEYILANFNNLPHPTLGARDRRACVWRGDFARFIYDNLTAW